MRYANQGESVTPPSAPDLSERGLENIGIIGNYENLQHDEVCVFKYKTIDDTTRVGILLNDATGYNMADFWIYCATGATITVTHADGAVLSHIGTNAYYNFNNDYTGVDAFYTGEIVIDTDSGEGSYYFAELMSAVGGNDSNIQECMLYIYMSDNINLMPAGFLRHANINNIIISRNADTDAGNFWLSNCFTLSYVYTNGISNIIYASMQNAYSLEYLQLNATTINFNVGQTATSLKFLEFNNTTSIGSSSFIHCSSLNCVILSTTTPPIVSSPLFLENIPKSCIIYVPLASLTAYKTNTNMTHLADQMVGY